MRHALRRSRSRRLILLLCAVATLLALAGCGLSASTSPAGDDKPTIPPSDGTATPTVTPVIATPASIVGWQTYTDSSYHFKTVIPPGWHVVTIADTTGSLAGGNCEYDVVYFPPGDTRAVEPRVWVGMHEHMLITVYLGCQPFDASKNRYLTRLGTVTISGAATTLYGQDSDEDVGRIASANFGGHQYSFFLAATSEQHTPITADVPLYLGVLNGFAYLGAK